MDRLDDELTLLSHGYLLVTVPVAAQCLTCGALTLDPDTHNAWHEEQS